MINKRLYAIVISVTLVLCMTLTSVSAAQSASEFKMVYTYLMDDWSGVMSAPDFIPQDLGYYNSNDIFLQYYWGYSVSDSYLGPIYYVLADSEADSIFSINDGGGGGATFIMTMIAPVQRPNVNSNIYEVNQPKMRVYSKTGGVVKTFYPVPIKTETIHIVFDSWTQTDCSLIKMQFIIPKSQVEGFTSSTHGITVNAGMPYSPYATAGLFYDIIVPPPPYHPVIDVLASGAWFLSAMYDFAAFQFIRGFNLGEIIFLVLVVFVISKIIRNMTGGPGGGGMSGKS